MNNRLVSSAYKVAWLRSLPRPDPVIANDPGFSLPYLLDASDYYYGALPDPWVGSTFKFIASNLYNYPILGSELLTDTSLEANYTAGKCDTLSKNFNPTLAQSADAHSGAKAQEFTATGANDAIEYHAIVPTAQTWYKFTGYGKRTAGAADTVRMTLNQAGGIPATSSASYYLTDAAYARRPIVKRTNSVNALIPYIAIESGAGPFDTVLVDDGSLRAINSANMFALLDAGESDVIVKVRFADWELGEIAGCVVRADADTNPSTFLVVYYWYQGGSDYTYVILDKCVSGVYTNLIADWTNNPAYGIGYAPDDLQWLEIRCNGSTVQVFQNEIQIGADQTVTDVPVTNTHVGIVNTGGTTNVSMFYCAQSEIDYQLGAWGNSLTAPTNGWADLVRKWLIGNYPQYDISYTNQARDGNWPWSNLVRLNENLLQVENLKFVLCDFRPTNTGRELESAEALIRRIWTAYPNAAILSPIFPSTTDMVNVAPLGVIDTTAQALERYYGIPLINYRQAVIDRVAGGELLTAYMADGIHPTQAGHALCASLIEAYITAQGTIEISADHTTLPARQYDNGDYEAIPTRTLGMYYASRTGAGWADTGTRTESSTAGDTITFNATCKSFGLYSAGTANTEADVQFNGGAWNLDHTVSHNGYDTDFALGTYAITIRVIAGKPIRIDEFWTI